MTSHSEGARIARRMIRAAESASFDALSMELGAAELLAGRDEERLELLGAIARDMRAAIASSTCPAEDLRDSLIPHLQLLRHLSQSRVWVN